jgi:hypothetical protein
VQELLHNRVQLLRKLDASLIRQPARLVDGWENDAHKGNIRSTVEKKVRKGIELRDDLVHEGTAGLLEPVDHQ